tara:strand:- start:385 stop:954 length:570 start_codon:yes stop_codon:yes gene_type:complete
MDGSSAYLQWLSTTEKKDIKVIFCIGTKSSRWLEACVSTWPNAATHYFPITEDSDTIPAQAICHPIEVLGVQSLTDYLSGNTDFPKSADLIIIDVDGAETDLCSSSYATIEKATRVICGNSTRDKVSKLLKGLGFSLSEPGILRLESGENDCDGYCLTSSMEKKVDVLKKSKSMVSKEEFGFLRNLMGR